MKTKGKTAATAAHDLQAGSAYRMAVCARCGAAFAYPNRRRPRVVCDACQSASALNRRRREEARHGDDRNDLVQLGRENDAIRKAQRGRAAARRAALRERDAEHAAWCAANGVTPVCGVGAPDKPFTPFNPGI